MSRYIFQITTPLYPSMYRTTLFLVQFNNLSLFCHAAVMDLKLITTLRVIQFFPLKTNNHPAYH
jgi:hypothetical protein